MKQRGRLHDTAISSFRNESEILFRVCMQFLLLRNLRSREIKKKKEEKEQKKWFSSLALQCRPSWKDIHNTHAPLIPVSQNIGLIKEWVFVPYMIPVQKLVTEWAFRSGTMKTRISSIRDDSHAPEWNFTLIPCKHTHKYMVTGMNSFRGAKLVRYPVNSPNN